MKGIDVSVHQGEIDWKKVKSDGIDFAMVKISQGGSINDSKISPFNDKYYEKNLANATDNGILCGSYHYLTGTTESDVKKEAKFFVESLKPYRDFVVYPCAIDMEEARYKKLSKDANAKLIKAFAAVVEEAGFKPMLYTNRDFSYYYINMSLISDLDVWFALYRIPRSNAVKPAYVDNITIWQWTDSGAVNGVKGAVSQDEGYFDYAKPKVTVINVNDRVEIKDDAKKYYPGGATIPSWVKNDYYHIVTSTTYRGNEVYKSGEKCVLLGKKVSKKTGKVYDGIMTWTAESTLRLI